jgi:hypothetical protein
MTEREARSRRGQKEGMPEPIYIRSWESFQAALVETLASIEPWHFMVVRERSQPQCSVRFAMEDARLHGEAAGNDFLPPSRKITSEDELTMQLAGWQLPREGSWWADQAWPAATGDYRRMAARAVTVLRDVFRVQAPTALETEEGRNRAPAPEGTVVRRDGPGSDVGPRRLEQTVEFQLATRPGQAEQAEALLSASLRANDLALRGLESGDRQALAAAEDLARSEAARVVPPDGCSAEAGMRHLVAVARDRRDRPRRLLVLEAVGAGIQLGSRVVGRPGTWADRGSPPYLRWMLEHDPHLTRLFAADTALRQGVVDGTVTVDYRLVRVLAQGPAISPVDLSGFDPSSLHLVPESQA